MVVVSENETQPGEREPFEFPTKTAFEKSMDTLYKFAVFATELKYPKGEADEELVERADELLVEFKELQGKMAEARGLTKEEYDDLVCGRADEVFLPYD